MVKLKTENLKKNPFDEAEEQNKGKSVWDLAQEKPDYGMIALPRERLPGVWDYDKQLDQLLGDPDIDIEDLMPLDVKYDFGRIVGMTEKPDETKDRMKSSLFYSIMLNAPPRITFNILDSLNKIALEQSIKPSSAWQQIKKKYQQFKVDLEEGKPIGERVKSVLDMRLGDAATAVVTKAGIPEIFQGIREMIAPTIEYTREESERMVKEIPDRLKLLLTYYASLGGRLGPKGLRESLQRQAEEYAGFGPALVPAAGEAGTLAIEWGVIYPALFKAVGIAGRTVENMPRVVKATEAIKKLGGLEKIAEKYPRVYARTANVLKAFGKGAGVGTFLAGVETIGKDMESGEILQHTSKRALLVGGIAATFQVASQIDTARYIKRLRNALTKATNARFDAKIREVDVMPISTMKSAAYSSLASLKKAELQAIDRIVSTAEAQLIGLKAGKLYQLGQEMVESPQRAAERLIKYGLEPGRPLLAGVKTLKKGLGKTRPFIEMPMTKTAEAIEASKAIAKAIKHPLKLAQKIAAKAPAVMPKVPAKPPAPPPVGAELKAKPEETEQKQFEAEVAEMDRELAEIQKGAMAEAKPTEAKPAPEKPVAPITKPKAVGVAPEAKAEPIKVKVKKAIPTREELYEIYEQQKAIEDKTDREILGDDLEKYNRAQRRLGSMNDKVVERAEDVIEEIESKLTKAEINKLYGIGEKGRTAEDLRTELNARDDVADALDEGNREKALERLERFASDYEWARLALERIAQTKAKPVAKAEPIKIESITEPEIKALPKEVLTDEQMTKAEMGEIPIEGEYKSQSVAFNEHLDYFQNRQLPKTSKIPGIQAEIRTVNGKRLAGTITAQAANKKIHQLRKQLFLTARKEGVALRMTRGGKISLSVRKAGTFVPEEFAQYGKFKNISPILGGGQDITRAIQQMDGSLSVKGKLKEKGQAGPLERHILWPTRDISIQKLDYIKEKTVELKSIFQTKKGTEEDAQVNLVLEKIAKEDRDTPIKDILNRKTLRAIAKPEIIKQAIQLREFYDSLIEEQNLAREMRDQDTIPYRHNYSPHILRDTTIWERLMMTGKKAKDIKAELPDYIKPNAPFNPRAMAREAGIEYEKRVKSAQELSESYLVTAAKDIFNTSIIQNNKAFIQQLEAMGHDKSANYLADWTAEAYAGVKPRLDRAISVGRKAEKAARYFNRLRNMAVFPLNFSWSLLTQTSSLALTIGRYGLHNTMEGFRQWLDPEIRKQATEDYYSYIVKSEKQGRITRQDAQNLIGQNVKLRRTSTEIARDISTLLLDQLEKLLTGTSIRAAYLHGQQKGLTGEALKNYASDGGAKTQSMYNDEDKPALLRNLTIKTGAPYQTFAYEVVNTMREWAGKTGTPPDSALYAIWTVTRFLAAAAVFSALGKKFGKKEIWSWKRPPIPFAEFWLNPIVKRLSNQWIGSASGLTSPVETAQRVAKGIEDILEVGSWRKLRKELLTYGPGIFGIPGGVQLERTVDAIIAYAQGGVKDRKGRMMFKMEDPQDLIQAIFSGVWSTKGGREYLEPKKTVRKRIKRSE